MSQEEMSLDDFEVAKPLTPAKPVTKINPQALEAKLEQKNEAGQQGMMKLSQEVIQDLDEQVDLTINTLVSNNLNSDTFKSLSQKLSTIGNQEIIKSSQISNRMLDRPLKALRKTESGDDLASALKDLRAKVTDLDPSQNKVWSKKTFRDMLPFGMGKKVDSYMQEFQSSQDHLNAIMKSLFNGKDALLQDNAAIEVEQEEMQKVMEKIEKYAYVIKKLDKRIEERLAEIEQTDQLKAHHIKEDILFPLRQKGIDLYQHMAVCMQGHMALSLIKKNNKELIRGVDRATTTTMAALRTAVIVSTALGTQQLVLDLVTGVNDTTNKLIAGNAQLLKTQGVAIQKQATEASINMETLQNSFKTIVEAMNEIDSFRVNALPGMKKTLDSLEETVTEAKKQFASEKQKHLAGFREELLEDDSTNESDITLVKKTSGGNRPRA